LGTGQGLTALALGTAATVVLIALVSFALRRSRLIRRFSVVLYIAALAAGLALALAIGPESWSEPGPLARLSHWLLLLTGALFVVRILALFIFEFQLHRKGVRLPPLLPAVIVGTAYVFAALGSYKAIYKADITTFLAASAVTSLVLGLALQPILGNFFSGLVISLEKPFRINDWIRVGETDGQVIQVTWRTTHLRTRDNDNLVVPNAQIASAELTNYFYPHPLHLERIEVGVHYRTPPYRVREALLAAAARVPDVLEKPTADVYLLDFGDSAIVYELRIWVENIAAMPGIASQVRTAIWEEFKKRDIVIPYPIRTLEIEPEASRLEVTRPRRTASEGEARPRARLFVAQGADRGRAVRLAEGELIVGRSGGCGLTLSDPQASKQHIRIEFDGESYTLVDLGSTHGTRVNRRSVTTVKLEHLDRIHIGDSELVFESHGD
jgi:small-conductance mechanosensitive channel